MRTNLPVTSMERPFPRGRNLVTRTDLGGVITYVNDAVIATSGFTREELVGQGQNVLRHPDMPPEAFADLWKTIQSGRPWRGLIKNRCKNGDFYWVKTLVTPVARQNQAQEYLSLATEPTRQEVEQHERLYRAVREKRARLHRSVGLADRFFRMSFNTRYFLFMATMAILALGAGMAGLAGWKWTAMGLALSVAGLAVVSTIFMAYTVSRPLKKILQHFDQISQGNLDNDIDVTGLDEAGRVLAALAMTQARLRIIIDEIRQSVDVLEARCAELETEVARVSSHSQSQTDRIMQVSSAMEELSVSVSEVAKSAEGAAASAKHTMDIVEEGNRRMSHSLSNTDQVVAAVKASSEGIDRLNEAIGNVGAVTRMIKEIADQTNLLALNAAIEAARAGEHGRGFAVVADEVRKLAERTARSTEDINRMVEEIQATTATTVESMRVAAERVDEGRALIGETYESLGKITEASTEVTRMSSHIAAAAKEQSAATEDVAKNAEHMSQLIERNTVSVRQVEQTVAGLRQTAGQLHSLVAHFNA